MSELTTEIWTPESFYTNEPYNHLPLLPPKGSVESNAVLRSAIKAARALAELKSAIELIPDPGLLLRSIVLQEARSSSEIENIVTTNDALYRAQSIGESNAGPETKEVLRYQDAIWHGQAELNKGRPLSPSLLVEIVSTIRKFETSVRTMPGTRIANNRSETIYTPPTGKDVILKLLNNLCDYAYAEDGPDPLIRMAVMHYQFEAIHPFTDGNGRTGRIVNVLYLVATELLQLPVLYLSGYILANRTEYYHGLRGVTERGEWEPWILYMLRAVEATATETRKQVREIQYLMERALRTVREKMQKHANKELIEIIFRQPYIRISDVTEASLFERQTATRVLRSLEELGVLRSTRIGRDLLFINDALLEVLARAAK